MKTAAVFSDFQAGNLHRFFSADVEKNIIIVCFGIDNG